MSNINIENPEKRKLNQAVIDFSHKMKMRLFQKVEEGYNGWDDKEYRNIIIRDLLTEIHDIELMESNGQKCNKKRFVDIANRAMMLFKMCNDS